ncbi:MAG: UbiD family decarboxylase [Marinilabiliales bacterium]|nr:UbiD family decarboxylase [Marinilabiliales bacterium]
MAAGSSPFPWFTQYHPETGKTNAGMYRMQILDTDTTAMHWQRHKTGANHFEAWEKGGKRMPVSVSLWRRSGLYLLLLRHHCPKI